MKKSELKNLIERKKILKRSLEIVKESYNPLDEVGGFDDPDLMSQYHGNYFDELFKNFIHFDSLANEMVNSLAKIMDDEEKVKSEIIVRKYASFMEEYHDFLVGLRDKVDVLSQKSRINYLPGMGNIGMNETDY